MDYLTTDQAGKILGVTVRRVRALIEAGRLPAVKFGKVWMINKKDLKKVAVRKPGRPCNKGGRYGKS
jgi:excisionase family DNA binding protein